MNSEIFAERQYFKPFRYPECYDTWLLHEQIHWLGREIPLHDDVKDWEKLPQADKDFLSDAFRLFTQADLDVAGGYVQNYLPHFKHPEIRMMLLGFAAREAVHVDSYSYLTESLGVDDSFYSEFLNVPVMKEKHDFFQNVVNSETSDPQALLTKIAAISAFTEGMFLFSTFTMLLSYPNKGKMKGMGLIVSWSILDEQLHVKGLMHIFRRIRDENPDYFNEDVIQEIFATAEMMYELECAFIDYAYKGQTVHNGLVKEDLKQYVRVIIDQRLTDMDLPPMFNEPGHKLQWVEQLVASQNHENFFESRGISYAKATLTGSPKDVWGQYKRK